MTFLYRYRSSLDSEHLYAALGMPLLRGEQTWGKVVVQIWVLPKRFELQIGVRDGESRFMHRMSASTDDRHADKRAFERALKAALD